MGLGDNLLASGFARGAAARGKRVAFGDGQKIIWDHNSAAIFAGNPNVAALGSEGARDLEWVPFHRGNRQYNTHDVANRRWIWNYDFRAKPGEMFFTEGEASFANRPGSGFVLVEPHVVSWKSSAVNKRWPFERYQKVARYLAKGGYDVRQFSYGERLLEHVKPIKTPSFRHALAVMARSALYIGPEGGLHHGAAAVGVPGVVIFGGFIPPAVTGYSTHTNLAAGGEACGSLMPCEHCREALQAISVDRVHEAAASRLGEMAA